MRSPRARTMLGVGASAAVWAAVSFAPTDLAAEPQHARPPVAAARLPEPGPEAQLLDRIGGTLAARLPALALAERDRLAATIVREADAARLDPLLVLAVIEVESGFDVGALSVAGARGLMQLREPTLRRELSRHGLQGDARDPVMNVRAGVRYLHRLVRVFGREDLALMAYNAGPNRLLAHLRAGEIPERFQAYPRRVRAEQRRLQRGTEVAPALAVSHEQVGGPVVAARAAD
jgi:soluble lytic murein transglycosylase-like protein